MSREAPRKLRVDLPYDPKIPPLAVYPKRLKTHIRKDLCTVMFTAALFTGARTGKQLKCPTTEDRLKQLRPMYAVEYNSATRRDEMLPFAATQMDLEIIVPSEINQRRLKITWYHMGFKPKSNK